jgi:hypothetical protein
MRPFVTPEQFASNKYGWTKAYLDRFGYLAPQVFAGDPSIASSAPPEYLGSLTADLLQAAGVAVRAVLGEGGLIKDASGKGPLERLLTAPRCGRPDRALLLDPSGQAREATAADRWPWLDLLVHIDPANSNLQIGVVANAFGWAFEKISEVCGLRLSLVASRAQSHIWAAFDYIDGPWSTLAWSYLVNARVIAAMPDWKCEQRYDSGESWSPAMLRLTTLHELMHALGFEHVLDRPTSILSPALNMAWKDWDAGDVALLQSRYGKPRATPIPPVTPVPTPTPGTSIELSIGGKRYRIAAQEIS